jgi:uncharacterized protein (DUF3084 family)
LDTGLILIIAVLVLGGVLATVGDRIGTRVGKARLSLFNLRPRKTATLVTILTGILVSASTLGILLASSGPLRKGIFDLEEIQRDLRRTRRDLDKASGELQAARDQKTQTETELNQARLDEAKAQKLLTETNSSLKGAISERDRAKLTQTQAQQDLERTQSQFGVVSQQISRLRSDIALLQTERKRVVAEGEEEIRAKNAIIQEREIRLKELEARQDSLVQEIARLEQDAKNRLYGNIAVQRGQVLASAVVRIVNPDAAQQAADQLLREANRVATLAIRPGSQPQDQIIQITRSEVDRLVSQIRSGGDYVVRVSSAANYLTGETPVQVFTEAVPNQLVFRQGEVIAASTLDPSQLTQAQIQQRLQLLAAAASFRASRSGILTSEAQFDLPKTFAFIEKLREYQQPLELRVVAANNTFTAGPLQIELVAVDNGKILLRSQD